MNLIAFSERKELILRLDSVQELFSFIVHVSKLKYILMEKWDDLNATVAMYEHNLLVLLTVNDMIVATDKSSAYRNERHTCMGVVPYYIEVHHS